MAMLTMALLTMALLTKALRTMAMLTMARLEQLAKRVGVGEECRIPCGWTGDLDRADDLGHVRRRLLESAEIGELVGGEEPVLRQGGRDEVGVGGGAAVGVELRGVQLAQ